jgi:hypothetical protein
MGEVVEDVFPRGDVDADVVPFVGGISDRRRSISASPVETIWMTAAWPAARSASMLAISVGVFIEVSRWPKKRCLALSKADRAADFACRFNVPTLR